MSSFSTVAKNAMLDALTPDRVRLHSGDPGATGTSNAEGVLTAATFAAAASSARALSSDVDFGGLGANTTITWFSVWDYNSGTPVFLGRGEITSGDLQANAAGQYTLTTATSLQLNNPA